MGNKTGKWLIVVVMLLAFGSALLVACTSGASANRRGAPQSVSSSSPSVHMGDSNFTKDSVTLSKGSSLTLVDDTASIHIIQNGTWNNGIAQTGVEPGAPRIDQNFAGNDTHQIGPFTTAGIFKLFCTVHTGMNLTVVVR